jgi:hypothetical protein
MPPLNCTTTQYPDISLSSTHYLPPRQNTNWIIFYIQIIIAPLLVLAFFVLRTKWDRTRVRHTRIVGILSIGCILQAFVGPFTSANGYSQMYCSIRSFLALIIIPLFVCSMVMRLMEFTLSRRLQLASKTFYDEMLLIETGSNISDEEDSIIRQQRMFDCINPIRAVIYGFALAIQNPNHVSKEELKSNITTLRFLVRRKGFFSIISFIGLPLLCIAIIRVLASPGMLAGCGGCKLATVDIIILVLQSVAGVIYGSMVAWRARHDRDPFGLLREAKLLMITCTISFFLFLLSTLFPLLDDSIFDWTVPIGLLLLNAIFIMTIVQVFLAIQGEYEIHHRDSARSLSSPTGILSTIRFSLKKKRLTNNKLGGVAGSVQNSSPKVGGGGGGSSGAQSSSIVVVAHQSSDDGTIGSISGDAGAGGGGSGVVSQQLGQQAPKLKDVLSDPEALTKLEELLVDEWALESLLFIRSVDDWKASYYDVSEGANLARARRIVNYFVLENAVCSVNLPYRIVQTLKATILNNKGNKTIPYDVFDQARFEIAVIIEHGPLKRLYLQV